MSFKVGDRVKYNPTDDYHRQSYFGNSNKDTIFTIREVDSDTTVYFEGYSSCVMQRRLLLVKAVNPQELVIKKIKSMQAKRKELGYVY